MSGHEYVFPAIRGIQARREYYVSMVPLRLIPRIFLFDEEELRPELRAQRSLNKGRVPEIARYISENRSNYIFSALTASVDAPTRFVPAGDDAGIRSVGQLHIPMSARFIINDGQHRRAAIEQALRDAPELGSETIAVVFFLDLGLERCQQMFADLNRYAIRPARSLGVLYDHRDDTAQITKLIVLKSTLFKDLVEMERSTLAARSRKLFTLSAIYSATAALLDTDLGALSKDVTARTATASLFWQEVGMQFPEWHLVQERKITAGEVRREYIHSHAVTLQAIGRVGSSLLQSPGDGWKRKLKALKDIDWARSNASLWEGRAMELGKVSNTGDHVILTANAIKKRMKVQLTSEEQKLEEALASGGAR
jgi:DNA sulfur modification protein DndB